MTIEGEVIDALLRGVDAQTALTLAGEASTYFREDPKRLGYVPLVGFVVYGLLRPTAPSVRPSAGARVSREASPAQPDGRAPGGSDKAQRVSRRREPAPKKWAVPDLVPHGPLPRLRARFGLPPWAWERRGYITCILGSGGTGKSYVLEDLGIAALTAGEWFGLAVRPVRSVLYVDTELDREECERRAFPLARGRGLAAPPPGLHYLHLRHSLASEEGGKVVAREAKRVGAELILVDSMTIGSFDVAASDQNGWNRVYSGMERWGVPVVCIDHMDKGGKGAFGSMMKQAKIRSMLQLTLRADKTIRVEHTKSNFGRRVDPFTVYPEFDQAPGGVVRFLTERPSADDYREADGRSARSRPGPAEGTPPPGAGATPDRPALSLVPKPLGRDGVCGAILGWLQTAPPPAPWTRPRLRDGIMATRMVEVKNRGTVYTHLGHLLEDGLLVEADGVLRLGEALVKERSA